MKRLVAASIAVVLGFGVPATAFADLIFAGSVELFGQGFGANGINIVTGHDVGSSPHPAIESACIGAASGTLADCAATSTIVGGDEPPPLPPSVKHDNPTLSELGASSASQVGLIFNIDETGPVHALTLADDKLYLEFFNGTSSMAFFFEAPGSSITLAGEPGVGKAGFVFLLDSTQAAAADSFCGTFDCVIGAGFEVTGFDGGPETLTAVVIPEPGTLLLLGSGLVGFGVFGRRRAKRP